MHKLSSKSRRGLIISVIVLCLGLAGGAGYLLWSRLGQGVPINSSATTAENTANRQEKMRQYTNDTYSFSYPDKGWKLTQGDEASGNNPTLKTDNLNSEESAITMGAMIYIGTFPASEGKTYDELVKNPDALPEGVYTDIQKTTVAGLGAHSYTLNFEGKRYITEVTRGDTTYQIIFQVAEDQRSQYAGAYEQVVKSFKFK